MYDLTIIGGGPAGGAAAITAARLGHRVLLLERGKYPRHKVCGEFVSPESLQLLRTLLSGNANPEFQLDRPPITRGRLFVDGTCLEAPISPPAASISRIDLDASLWKAAVVSGADCRQQEVVLSVAKGAAFTVRTATEHFKSLAVIDASGRWSNLSASKLAPGRNGKRWLGLKAHFVEPAQSQSVDLYFFKGGYCGVQPLADSGCGQRINACAMVLSDVASTLSDVFALHPELQRRSFAWEQVTETVSTSPLLFRPPNPERDRILLAGDAAGFVDPFVGDGISLALRSGVMAAHGLHRFLRNEQDLEEACRNYRQQYEQELLPVFRTSSRIRRLFSLPGVVRIPLARLFQHAPALTRYLVQKTR